MSVIEYKLDPELISEYDVVFAKNGGSQLIFDTVLPSFDQASIKVTDNEVFVKRLAKIFGNSYSSIRKNSNYDFLFPPPDVAEEVLFQKMWNFPLSSFEDLIKKLLAGFTLLTISESDYNAINMIVPGVYRAIFLLEKFKRIRFIYPSDDVVGKADTAYSLMN